MRAMAFMNLHKLLHVREPSIEKFFDFSFAGGQAVQMAKAGLQSIYLSGWQVAADSNMAGQTYPDQSLYPANSAAKLVERINNAFIRADQIAHMEGSDKHIDFFLPIVTDCEAGFGGPLNAFEITKAMVRNHFFFLSCIAKA